MQLTKTVLIFLLSLFYACLNSPSAKAQEPATTTTIENTTTTVEGTTITVEDTTTERRTYDGEPPPSDEDSPPRNPFPGENLCKTQTEEEQNPKLGSQRIELHYVRDAANITTMLQGIKDKLALNNLEIYQRGEINNEIILYGAEEERKCAYRIIAAIDLPRPGINMQMWGIQISTDKSSGQKALNEVMPQVRDRINLTQQLVRDTFVTIQSYATNRRIDTDFKSIVKRLGYEDLFDTTRPLSLLDIVIMANSAKKPLEFNKGLFKELMRTMEADDRYEPYLEAMKAKERPPFESFFRSRGLEPECVSEDVARKEIKKELQEDNPKLLLQDLENRINQELQQQKLAGNCQIEAQKLVSGKWRWKEVNKGASMQIARQNRRLIVEFGLQYGDFISNPDLFSPYRLQHTSDALNGRLQDTTNAIQKDIEEFFMLPTLSAIQDIVNKEKSVTYAQLGRTTAATLSGVETNISTNSVSAFDVTPPLKLSDLLTRASELEGQVTNFILPTENIPGADAAKEFAVGSALPASKIVALVAAFAEQDSVYRELETGVSLSFTPNVLRDLSSSELTINLTMVDPVASPTQQEGVKPLSRIGKQTVNTTVYTQAVDFFALSTFSNQSTLDGGRGYVPIIGQVWRGIFSAIPVFGNLLSWQRPPQNVQHESLLLTNSFITPTSMGLALLYPMGSEAYKEEQFCQLQAEVEGYIKSQKHTIWSNEYEINEYEIMEEFDRCVDDRQETKSQSVTE